MLPDPKNEYERDQLREMRESFGQLKKLYPIGFNQKSMLFFPLHKKNSKGHNVPLIKGIPMELKFMKGDVMEVTQKQYDELVAEGCVETDEEYQMRKEFLKGMKDQYPKNFSALEVAEKKGDLISAHESQRIIYKIDKSPIMEIGLFIYL